MITSGQLTITTTRVKIDGTAPAPCFLVIHNSGSNAVVIGNETVTENTGFKLHANDTIQFSLPAGESLYAVSSSGSHDISWLRIVQ